MLSFEKSSLMLSGETLCSHSSLGEPLLQLYQWLIYCCLLHPTLITILQVFCDLFFFSLLHGMGDLSSLTRDRTRAPYSGSEES